MLSLCSVAVAIAREFATHDRCSPFAVSPRYRLHLKQQAAYTIHDTSYTHCVYQPLRVALAPRALCRSRRPRAPRSNSRKRVRSSRDLLRSSILLCCVAVVVLVCIFNNFRDNAPSSEHATRSVRKVTCCRADRVAERSQQQSIHILLFSCVRARSSRSFALRDPPWRVFLCVP